MSIFQAATPAEGTTAKFDDLVGDGKKFKDPDALANAKLESDRFIAKLQEEQKELRAELEKQLQIAQAKATMAEGTPKTPEQTPAPKTPTSEDDLDARVNALLARRESQSVTQRNIDAVTSKMTELYGTTDKAAQVIASKASELGMSTKELGELASKNPKAYYRLMGIDETKNEQPTNSSSWRGVNAEARKNQNPNGHGPKPGTYSYYQELRKSDPATFFSPRIQLQMDKDNIEAQRKGVDFKST